MSDRRRAFLELIRTHIAATGRHVTLVAGSSSPRWGYTIGLTERDQPELVLAGAASLTKDEVLAALNGATDGFETPPVHPSWTAQLLLGALDYYDRKDVPALQLVPDEARKTIDVPDLSVPYDPAREPVWRWLTEPWPYPFPEDATVMTDLDALKGYAVEEAARWEEDYWEATVEPGPSVPAENVRAVPLATLLGYDETLGPVAELAVGEGLLRDYPGPWRTWTSKAP